MNPQFKQLIAFIFLLVAFLLLVAVFLVWGKSGTKKPRVGNDPEIVTVSNYPPISQRELMKHDGSDSNLGIYIALDGYVYDVSAGRKFYAPGAVYHYLAGKDSSKTLHIMGGDLIKQKYPIVGIFSAP